MVSRREFLQFATAAGLALPLAACSSDPVDAKTYEGRVVVIGAGAAGMSAAYGLVQRGVDVTVLEAAPTHGGRIKRLDGFVDFPIPLGGEWLHSQADDRIFFAGDAYTQFDDWSEVHLAARSARDAGARLVGAKA